MKKIIVLSALIFTTFFASAQENINEGIITFSAEWQVPEGMPDQVKEALPKELKMYFKDNRSATNIGMNIMGNEMNIKVLFKSKPAELLMLMDMMGQKMGVRTSEEDIKKIKDTLDVSYEYFDFKKKIAGYDCQKVIMTNKKTGDKSEMFITEQLQSPALKSDITFQDLKGVPLEYVQNQNGMKIKMTAQSISKVSVDDKIFEVPTEYQIMTLQEAAKLGGRN